MEKTRGLYVNGTKWSNVGEGGFSNVYVVRPAPFRLNPKLLLLFLVDVSWRVYVRASNIDGIAADVMKWRE